MNIKNRIISIITFAIITFAIIAFAIIASAVTPVTAFAGGNCTDWENYDYYYSDNSCQNENDFYQNYIGNDYYTPVYGEGWYSIYDITGYTKQQILEYNGLPEDYELQYGDTFELPAPIIDYDKYYNGDSDYNVNYSNTYVDYSNNNCDVDDNNSWTWDNTETEQEDNNNIWYGVSEEIIGEKTLYNNPYADSWHNIVRAAEMVDGAEIANGEEFSMYNQFPNQAGEADGMVEAEYFIDENRKGRTFGSGICFFGTTSAQAVDEVADEGLTITERHPHVQDVGYAIRGVNDAALNFAVDPANRQDLKILNETGGTVRLNYYVDSAVGALTCTITKLGEFLKS